MRSLAIKLNSPANLETAKYAQIGIAIIAAAACGYMAITAMFGIRDAWSVRRQLGEQRAEVRHLEREVGRLRSRRQAREPSSCGGPEALAVALASWSRDRGITIDSVTPEGLPSPTEIKVGSASLGTWTSSKVRVRGQGKFPMLMQLLGEFREPDLPVQLESFAFESSNGAGSGRVAFDLLLTVYGRKGGT